MRKAVVVTTYDWEWLFVNWNLVKEGHSLNQGMERILYFKKAWEEYSFDIKELDFIELTEEEDAIMEDLWNFYSTIEENAEKLPSIKKWYLKNK